METDKSYYSNVVPRFPKHVQETMAELSLEQQQKLYLDIFKPLDFYELLFEHMKKTRETESYSAGKTKKRNSSDNQGVN